jgi:D-alanine transaminase
MEHIAYIDGEFVAAADAKISVFDRGFLFADSIYEVLPVYQGRAYFVERHLARLENSLASTKIPLPKLDWSSLFQELISRNGGGDLQIYLQITRGNQGSRQHDIPKQLTPTVVAYTLHTPYPTFTEKQHGLHALLVDDIRWMRCNIKTTSLIANILLNDEAVSQGANTALLIRDGYLTEGSSSNAFIVDTDGSIKTPPDDNLCLPGITRQLTIELIKKLKWPFHEEKISKKCLLNAKEVWITSTSKEIYPVTRIDKLSIGTGVAGEYWQQIDNEYQHLIKNNHD